MGNPQNFSIDVPRRCQILLEQLWPSVSNKADGRLLPLNASFLLAISTPMVNLPIERIWKPQNGRAVGHLNDAVLDASLAKAVKADIGQSPVAQAPFYKAGAWRYHYLPKGVALPDLSKLGLPTAVQQALAADGALTAANALAPKTFCSILRNGLAHGGVSLPRQPRPNHGRRAGYEVLLCQHKAEKSGRLGPPFSADHDERLPHVSRKVGRLASRRDCKAWS